MPWDVHLQSLLARSDADSRADTVDVASEVTTVDDRVEVKTV